MIKGTTLLTYNLLFDLSEGKQQYILISQKDIADAINSTPRTVIRCLKKLEEKKYITSLGRKGEMKEYKILK